MSLSLLIAALIDVTVAVFLATRIRTRYRSSLTSVQEKSAGALFYYRNIIRAFFRGDMSLPVLEGVLHYMSLHLLVPLVGLGLFLRTDVNFLVVIIAMVVSMQLYQRVYPGSSRREEIDQ